MTWPTLLGERSGHRCAAYRRVRCTARFGLVAYFLTTISALVFPTISNNSFCSAAGTLNLSRDFLNSAAMIPHSFSLIFRCAWASFIAFPVYLHGPPLTSQTNWET